MTSSTHHQVWLFYSPLALQASLLKDDLLDPVDQLLDDEELIQLVRPSLATRCPQSTRTGRPGLAPDRLLRCCGLKHLKAGASAIGNASCAATSSIAASPISTPKSSPVTTASVV